jgi:CheY-like chemotaxis protein
MRHALAGGWAQEVATRHVLLHAVSPRGDPDPRRGQARHRRPATEFQPWQAAPRQPLAGLRLLVVEDHPDSREYLRRLLTALGASVLVAEHGRQALYILEETRRPHAILLDILMPVMDGFTFVERMSQEPRWARIPVVAVTALGSGRDIVRTWEAGFAGHLTKPI